MINVNRIRYTVQLNMFGVYCIYDDDQLKTKFLLANQSIYYCILL